ncbi:MAG: hypothetical protein ACM30D_12165 [Hyphomicrobiales bacterium]
MLSQAECRSKKWLREYLTMIAAIAVFYGRYITIRMAEVAINLFAYILRRSVAQSELRPSMSDRTPFLRGDDRTGASCVGLGGVFFRHQRRLSLYPRESAQRWPTPKAGCASSAFGS